ncbi:hypothetical protein EV175_006088 [Coemansia sp. RSA 1933]|nr:hypothetical protein EV175_006088 [Coemansia sp. RSA 1933]
MLTPAVLKACQEAVGKLQARGMVPESTSKASGMMFMAKLMRDPESVKIITELMETLKKEGVDVSPASMKKMMEEFTNMGANASNFASAQLKEKDNVLQQPSAQNDEEQPQKKTISDYLGGSWFKR